MPTIGTDTKRRLLDSLAGSLSQFFPEVHRMFRCPVCLKDTPVDRLQKITVAHLIPKAAGGKTFSWLCHACNSKFGHGQDKWFGEHANLRMMPSPSPFKVSHPARSFMIGGVKVNGSIEEGEDGSINVYIYSNLNSPETLARLEGHTLDFKKAGESTLTFEVPIWKHRDAIRVGYLTCAYLLWFKTLGYSFALQSHLQPVRDQILKHDATVLPVTFQGIVDNPFPEPWVSFGYLHDRPVLAAGIVDRVILLPAYNRPNLLDGLDPNFKTHHLQKLVAVPLYVDTKRVGPFGVLLDEEIFVLPDVMRDNPTVGACFRVRRDGQKPDLLRSITPALAELIKSRPHELIKVSPPDPAP
jgi:hypothetical protein